MLQLVANIKVVGDRALAAARDQRTVHHARLDGLLDPVLHQRFVHDREHFLGHALGRGQEPGAVARYRKQAFTNHVGVSSLPYTSSNRTISSSPRYEPDCTSITSSGTAPRLARRCFIPIGMYVD